MYTYIHTHTYLIHTYTHTYVIHTHTYIHAHICTYTYIHIYIYTHTYIHNTYIHTYIHTYIIHITYIRTYIHTSTIKIQCLWTLYQIHYLSIHASSQLAAIFMFTSNNSRQLKWNANSVRVSFERGLPHCTPAKWWRKLPFSDNWSLYFLCSRTVIYLAHRPSHIRSKWVPTVPQQLTV